MANESITAGVIGAYTENHLFTLTIFTGVSIAFAIYDDFIRIHRFPVIRFLERWHPRRLQQFNAACEWIFGVFPLPLDEGSETASGRIPGFLDRDGRVRLRREQIHLMGSVLTVAAITSIALLLHFVSYWLHHYLVQTREWLPDDLWLKRAIFLPFILGGTISILTVFGLISYRIRFPIIIGLFAVASAVSFIFGDGHDVREIYADNFLRLHRGETSVPFGARYVGLNASIDVWKQTNGWNAALCSFSPDDPACPRPIIVVTEGGASRSAFFTASILAKLEDMTAQNPASLRRFSQQLFAISSVSGGSLGAGIFASLLLAEQKDKRVESCFAGSKAPGCTKGLYAQHLWFRDIASTTGDFLSEGISRQEVAQAIGSNDFLTPTIVALLARDVTQLSSLPGIWNRAAALEASWEDAAEGVLRPMASEGNPYTHYIFGNPLSFFAWENPKNSNELPVWRPLLLFNATSVTSGRRVIVTSLNPVAQDPKAKNPNFRVFADAHNYYELACDREITSTWLRRQLRRQDLCLPDTGGPLLSEKFDIALSTAISLSARFPVITPHGNIRNDIAGISDRLVDGGYFDNSGAVTGLELAASMKRVDANLRPYLLQISNEPEFYRECAGQAVTEDKSGKPPLLPNRKSSRPRSSVRLAP